MRAIIELNTNTREVLVDITAQVKHIVKQAAVKNGLLSLYAQGATCAIMVQENWDDSVPLDMVDFLKKLIPPGVWRHDRQDNNGDAHLKAGLVGPSEVFPLIEGEIGLSRWQNIFFCEFDGPRSGRKVVCTLIEDRTD